MSHATNARFVLAATLAAAALSLLLIPGTALAARGHELTDTFGSGEPYGVAVNEATGNIYVADRAQNKVDIFDANQQLSGEINGSGLLPNEGKAAGSGSEPWEVSSGGFSGPTGIAVDNSCHRLGLSGSQCQAADPSNGDVYVIDGGHFVIDKYTANGEYAGQITRTLEGGRFEEELSGVAVATDGTVDVAALAHGDSLAARVFTFNSMRQNGCDSCVVRSFLPFRAGALLAFLGRGLAVDSRDNVYLASIFLGRPDFVADYAADGTFLGKLDETNTEPVNGLAVEAGTDNIYVGQGNVWRRFSSAGTEIEHLAIPGGEGAGIAVDPGIQTVYVADPSADLVYAYAPEAPAAPRLEGVSALNIAATSATLEAQVNPRSEPNEAPTTYRFEYLTEAEYRANLEASRDPFAGATVTPEPEGQISPTFETEAVSVHVQGLQSHTAYRYRVLAGNGHGGVTGEALTFTTQTSTAFSLLDSRGWELVSPPEKHGAELVPIGRWNVDQASISGDAVTYPATTATEADPEGNSNYSQVLSVRGPQGWSSRDLAQPHPSATGATTNQGQEYRFFSEDLSLSVLQPFGLFEPSLSPEATERTAYLRRDFASSGPPAFCDGSCFSPLVTAENATSGQPFGREGTCFLLCGPEFLAASPDGRSVILRAGPLLPGAHGSLYEYSEGTLRPIDVLPDGAPAVGFAVPGLLDPEGAGGSHSSTFAHGAVSDDGSRVFFTETGGNHHLFMRFFAGEVEGTILLDAPAPGAEETGPIHPRFQWATPNGSRVFFTDEQRLTAGSGAEEGKPDLYECVIEEVEEGTPTCSLADLTPRTASGEAAKVVGGVLGASASGDSVYFVADAVLASNAGQDGEEASPGGCAAVLGEASEPLGSTCNLYLRRGGSTTYIATLSGEDSADFWSDPLSGAKARVSPDGRWLAFMSQRPLTGYDNRDAVSGKRDAEVFLYHAGAAGGPGDLICASCDPTGARPHGVEFKSIPWESSPVAGGGAGWNATGWLAGAVPGYTPYRGFAPVYQSRYLSDGGRLFFNSSDALVPSDSNGTWDVYEYEPPASGGEEPAGDSCEAASPTYSASASGCVDLVSSGTSAGESGFLDASEGGQDVFFFTQSRLSSRDRDSVADVYDARIGGGEVEAAGAVRCLGDACQPPAAAPIDSTPGSLTFDGAGNLSECPKGKQLKKGKCVAKKAKKGHKKHHKKSAKGHKRNKRDTGHKKGGPK